MLSKRFLAGLCAITLLSGCSLFSDKELVKVAPLPQVANQFQPKQVWSSSVGEGIGKYYSHLHPAFYQEVVYAADRHGIVKAINSVTGKQIWKIDLSENRGFLSANESVLLSGGIAAMDNSLYIGSEHGKLYALNTIDGSIRWQVDVAGEALSTPVVTDSMVLIHTSNGILQALSTHNGSSLWTVNIDEPLLSIRGESTPALAHGAAIVGSSAGRLNAVLLSEGMLIWQQRIAEMNGSSEIARIGDVDLTPVIADDIVYAAAYNGNLAAVDLRSGNIIWQQKIGSVTNLVIQNNRLYLADQEDRILALDRLSGNRIWVQEQLLHRQVTSPVIYQGYLVLGDSEGYLHWLNLNDGHFVAQNRVSRSGLLSAPQDMAGLLLIQARNGKVYSYTK